MTGSSDTKFMPHPLSILSLSIIAILWCGLTYSGLVPPFFLPSPTDVYAAFIKMHHEGILVSYTLISLYRVVVGFGLAALVAIPLGLIMGSSKSAEAFFGPTIEFTRYLPVVALVPLLVLYLGIGDLQKIAVIWIGTFFQLVLMVAAVTADVSKDLIKAAYTMGADKWQAYRHVLIPASLPGIMDNLRITIGWAWTYLVVAELVAANSGLGFMILRSQRFLQTDRIFAGLIIIGLLGVLTDYLFKYATKTLLPWSERNEVAK